jgi:hypothetical protein
MRSERDQRRFGLGGKGRPTQGPPSQAAGIPPSNRLTRLTGGPIAVKSRRSAAPILPIAIGAVEHVNRSLTRPDVSCYVPPQRAMPADAFAVHGLSVEFLVDKPLFGAVADELLTSSAMPRLWRTMRALILPFSMPS